MSSSNPKASQAPQDETHDAAQAEAQAEAQRAADGLRGQIAAIRSRVRNAQDHLRDQHSAQRNPLPSKG